MSGFAFDIRLGLKTLRRSRGFVTVAMLTIALGIAVNTATFSVLYAVLWKPHPFPEPERLVALWPEKPWSVTLREEVAERVTSFSALSVYSPQWLILVGEGWSETVRTAYVSTDHFDVLGVSPALGTGFEAGDGLGERGHVVVISHALWQRRFAGDPDVVGSTIRLAGFGVEERTIVGVLPEGGPLHPRGADAVVPYIVTPGRPGYVDTMGLLGVGRLAPGITVDQASRELRGLVDELAPRFPAQFGEAQYSLRDVVPLLEAQTRFVRPGLLIVLGAATVILLIACVNVANLLLARMHTRREVVALRMVLGGSRRRVVRQAFIESAILCIGGGLMGVAAVFAAMPAIREFVAGNLARAGEISLDPRVLAFSIAVTALAALVSGLVPAWKAATGQPAEVLRGTGGRSVAGERNRASHAFLVAELALCVVVVVAATMMLKSMLNLHRIEPGFATAGVLAMELTFPPQADVGPPTQAPLRIRVEDAVRSVPGVVEVGSTNMLPLTGMGTRQRYRVRGRVYGEEGPPLVDIASVTRGYFDVMSIGMVEGRSFNADDVSGANAVIVVNEAFAREYWPDGGAIGGQVDGEQGPLGTIVGVVGDTRHVHLARPPRPAIYLPFAQAGGPPRFHLVVRGATGVPTPDVVVDAILAVEPNIAVRSERPMGDIVHASMGETRFYTQLLGMFAVMALVLSVVGVFGTVAYSVSLRARELGVRQAVGATPTRVVAHVVKGLMVPVGIGALVGLPLAFFAARPLSGLVFGDVAGSGVFVGVALAIAALGAAAAAAPAFIATRANLWVVLKPD